MDPLSIEALGARTYYWNTLLVEPLMAGLKFLADPNQRGLGAGVAIILFTILIRVVLLPLTVQQIRSQKAMQRLQPEIKALQRKYGKDREKVQAETMALYKEYGVNPAAGCLPMVLQMPILFALYAAMRNLASDPHFVDAAFQAPFLWLQSLNQPDILQIGTVKLPFILPIVAAGTQWVQQRMMTPPTDDPQQRMQNQMMQFMPLMMLYFGLTFSSGLALYWVTQNLFGIVQQYFSTGWGSLLPLRGAGTAGGGALGATSRNDLPAPKDRPGDGEVTGGAGTLRPAPRPGRRDGTRDRGTGGATSGAGVGDGAGAGGYAKREGRRTGGKR